MSHTEKFHGDLRVMGSHTLISIKNGGVPLQSGSMPSDMRPRERPLVSQ